MLKQLLFLSVLLLPFLGWADDENPTPQQPPDLVATVQDNNGKNILADSFQRTLYVFDLDKNQSTPSCEGVCAELWPPYIINNDEANRLQAPLGKTLRKSNKLQLLYQGRPVYTYTFDREKGDSMGDGVANLWHIIEVPVPSE